LASIHRRGAPPWLPLPSRMKQSCATTTTPSKSHGLQGSSFKKVVTMPPPSRREIGFFTQRSHDSHRGGPHNDVLNKENDARVSHHHRHQTKVNAAAKPRRIIPREHIA
jgi:hypothetical protein